MDKNYAKYCFYGLAFFGLILGLSVLHVTSSFFLPLTVSIMFSFVFYPLVKRLNSFKLPWAAGVLIVVALAVSVFVFVGNLLVVSLKSIINAYPRYEETFTKIYLTFASMLNLPFDEELSLMTNIFNSFDIISHLQNIAISMSNFMLNGAKVVVLISIFVIFLLIEMRDLKKKILRAFRREELGSKILRISTKIIVDITHYISIKFIISLATGLLVFLVCFFTNMDFAIVWGFLAFVMNFIPNFGSIISWALTSTFAMVQFYPSWGLIIYVSFAVLLINMVLGNIVEPRVMGSNLGISPFVILVSLSLWGYLWGFIGMILSVPMIVTVKIICENIDSLKPVAILIGNGKR